MESEVAVLDGMIQRLAYLFSKQLDSRVSYTRKRLWVYWIYAPLSFSWCHAVLEKINSSSYVCCAKLLCWASLYMAIGKTQNWYFITWTEDVSFLVSYLLRKNNISMSDGRDHSRGRGTGRTKHKPVEVIDYFCNYFPSFRVPCLAPFPFCHCAMIMSKQCLHRRKSYWKWWISRWRQRKAHISRNACILVFNYMYFLFAYAWVRIADRSTCYAYNTYTEFT